MTIEVFHTIFAVLTVVCSLMVILLRNPLSSAFFLILAFANLAGVYVLLGAHFVAAAQILVYAGAIMVLFIFVIMLLNLRHERWGFLDHRDPMQIAAALVAIASLSFLALAIRQFSPMGVAEILPADFGTIRAVATLMLTKYFVAFELISVLLLTAIIGAVLLAKRVI